MKLQVFGYPKDKKIIELQGVDYEDYYMDIDGNAYSTKKDSIYKLKKQIQSKGYECVEIEGRIRLIQRLMGNAFLGLDLNSKLQMNHINKCKTDNRLINLEVVTAKQNMRHAHGHKDYKEVK